MRRISRLLLTKLKEGFRYNRIVIILGSRQVGKTTLMQMYQEIIPKIFRSFYFNLEDISHLNICQNIESLKAYLEAEGLSLKKDKIFLIIDEFYYIKDATKLFKVIYDLFPNIYILASESSSIEIRKHLKESLAGRKRVYYLYPLTFEEFLYFKDEDEYRRYQRLRLNHPAEVLIDRYNHQLKDYLLFGGYPRVNLLSVKRQKVEEIEDIYTSYIQKDIKSLIKGEEIASYNNLLKILASQIGNLLNINELGNTLGIGRRIILKYLKILEETFIIKLLPPFYSNKRKEISKMPKLYFLDPGIVNFAIGNFNDIIYRPNRGSYLENFIFAELVKYLPSYFRVYFWRTKLGAEIDFIIEGDNHLIAVEVKDSQLKDPLLPKSIEAFFSLHPRTDKAVVVNKNLSAKKRILGREVYFIPAVFFNKYLKILTR